MSLPLQKQKSIEEFENKEYWRIDSNNPDTNKPIFTRVNRDLKHFISNIYIQIAEGEIERLEKSLHKVLSVVQTEPYIINISDVNPTIQDQINYWQEELNKLKQ